MKSIFIFRHAKTTSHCAVLYVECPRRYRISCPRSCLARRSRAFCPAVAEKMLNSCWARSNRLIPSSVAEESWALRLAT